MSARVPGGMTTADGAAWRLWRETQPHYVYRVYGEGFEGLDDDLLYIGCTYDVDLRMRQHARHHLSKRWFDLAVRIDVAKYPDLVAARVAEARAIKEEQPTWNTNRMHPRWEWVA